MSGQKTSFQMYDPTINRPCDKTTLRWVHLAMNRDTMNNQTSLILITISSPTTLKTTL
jgi:hypothetical protein